jgi:hypothetical protein
MSKGSAFSEIQEENEKSCGGFVVNNTKGNPERRWFACTILLSCLFAAACGYIFGCSREKPSQMYSPKVIVLDDCDADNDLETEPRGDAVLMLDSNGKLLKTISNFKVRAGFGENKAISVSDDGRFFAVCENADKKLTIYEISTGEEYWSKTWPDKSPISAGFFKDTLYGVNQSRVFEINVNEKSETKIDKFWDGSWLDFAVDGDSNCIWAAGLNVRKYSMDFEMIFTVDSAFDSLIAGAFSIDATSDGSAWVAVREVKITNGLENKLLKISPDGEVSRTINMDIAPYCLRVDQSDDSVWVTGFTSSKDYSKIGDEWPETLAELNELIKTDVQTYTYKYNSSGERIVDLDKGGYSIDINPSDKSVWIGTHKSVVHCSQTGEILSEYKNVSSRNKWVAVVKEGEK